MDSINTELEDRGITSYTHARLDSYSSFSIGGTADLLILPHSTEELIHALQICCSKNISVRVFGNCSNILLPDKNIDGAVICTKNLRKIDKNKRYILAETGTSISTLVRYCGCAGFGGMEKLYGIPGTVGGALYMNGGAFGASLSDHLISCRVFDMSDGKVHTLSASDLCYGYRYSSLMAGGRVLLDAVFGFAESSPSLVLRAAAGIMLRRRRMQPLEYPSAGSIFRRPRGHYASALIEQCGLKGLSIGGAAVSRKHAGFIINLGGATSEDVHTLIQFIQSKVFRDTGVKLDTEIEMW